MGQGRQALDATLAFLSSALGAVLPLIGQAEVWLRGQMAVLGVPPGLQTAAVLAVAAFLFLAVLRMLGGLLRIALVVFLLALAVRALGPAGRPHAPPVRHTLLRGAGGGAGGGAGAQAAGTPLLVEYSKCSATSGWTMG